jgi:hypothetical protein
MISFNELTLLGSCPIIDKNEILIAIFLKGFPFKRDNYSINVIIGLLIFNLINLNFVFVNDFNDSSN